MTVLSVKGPNKGANGLVWDIMTDLDPQTLSAVGVAIAQRWISFAMGSSDLGGKTLAHPTGRYASSIQFRQTGVARVAIVANEKRAPEAAVLETGHKPIDLKQYFPEGVTIPMHRGVPGQYGSAGYGAPILDNTAAGRRKNVWAKPRAQGATGFARMGTTGWIIPAMPAYSPAAHLVDLMRAGTFDG